MVDRVYKYRGDIERWNSALRQCDWKRGYSEDGENGGVLYPWNTMSECRGEARRDGVTAKFFNEGDES